MITIKAAINDLKQTARFASDAIRAINTGKNSAAGVAEEAARRLQASADLVDMIEAEGKPPAIAAKRVEGQALKHGTAFEYLEIRPAIEYLGEGKPGEIASFQSIDEFEEAFSAAEAADIPFNAMWTLYGRHDDGNGFSVLTAIGDFCSKAAALGVLNALLAPMAKARDLAEGDDSVIKPGVQISPAEQAAYVLGDFINQSSTAERI